MSNKFKYTYYAPTEAERREIESIKREYQLKDEHYTKMDYLRALDRKVRNIPMVIAILIGIIGTLIMGLGMTMVMEWNLLFLGIVIGIIGLCLISLAYPSYKLILGYTKRKYSGEILKISDELLNNNIE